MTYINTRAERSRIHIAMLEGFGLKGDEASFEASKKIAYAEVVSGVGVEEGDPSLWQIQAAADAASYYIFEETGGEIAEFDIPSLSAALKGSRRIAVLVARLCGAVPIRDGKGVKWRNASSAPLVQFPPNTVSDFLQRDEFE